MGIKIFIEYYSYFLNFNFNLHLNKDPKCEVNPENNIWNLFFVVWRMVTDPNSLHFICFYVSDDEKPNLPQSKSTQDEYHLYLFQTT